MVTITVLSVARSLPNRRHSLASHSIYLTRRKHEDIQETKDRDSAAVKHKTYPAQQASHRDSAIENQEL
jgi:hypothetical protein